MTTKPDAPCPCHSGRSYEICCQPCHTGKIPAPTALDLMRSRYSAYALGLADYLINTTHRDTPQYRDNIRAWREDITNYCQNTRFTRLEILEDCPGKENATVTFRASLTQQNQQTLLTEKSLFLKIGKRWLYHSGETKTTAL